MVSYRRTLKREEEPGQARYLTCSCYRRLPLFNNDLVKNAFVEHLEKVRDRLGFEMYAWVVMPEHIHLLLMPDPPHVTVTDVLRALKRPLAVRVLQRWRELEAPILARITDARGRPHFWQRGGGYDRNIFSTGELREKIDYIHDNPCRRGLVRAADDWRWSSMCWYEQGVGLAMDSLPM